MNEGLRGWAHRSARPRQCERLEPGLDLGRGQVLPQPGIIRGRATEDGDVGRGALVAAARYAMVRSVFIAFAKRV